MKRTTGGAHPLARTEELIIKELPDEVLVYDQEADRAHCLNETAAFVWRRCDGQTTPREIAGMLETEKRIKVDERVVWLALDQLAEKRLVVKPIAPPPSFAGLNRRQMVRALGIAAVVAVPVVTSIVAPTAAQAASCISTGQPCASSGQCCSGVCNGAPSGTCL